MIGKQLSRYFLLKCLDILFLICNVTFRETRQKLQPSLFVLIYISCKKELSAGDREVASTHLRRNSHFRQTVSDIINSESKRTIFQQGKPELLQ